MSELKLFCDSTLFYWEQNLRVRWQPQAWRQTTTENAGVFVSWSSHVANLRKRKLLKRVAALSRVKKPLPVKYRIILFRCSIEPILEYCAVSVWGSCNAGLLHDLSQFKL